MHKAKWYGTIVAVKILRRSDAVAVGDFRYAHHFHSLTDCDAHTWCLLWATNCYPSYLRCFLWPSLYIPSESVGSSAPSH